MDIGKKVKEALRKALDIAGTQLRLEEKTGIKQPSINTFLSGKRSTGNMTVNTLGKLFPEMEITFFRNERQAVNSDLSPMAQRIVLQLNNLDEESQLDALAYISELKGRAAAKHGKSARDVA